MRFCLQIDYFGGFHSGGSRTGKLSNLSLIHRFRLCQCLLKMKKNVLVEVDSSDIILVERKLDYPGFSEEYSLIGPLEHRLEFLSQLYGVRRSGVLNCESHHNSDS